MTARRWALALCLVAGPALAQTPAPAPEGFALQTYEPPPAGDRFFAAPDATAPGHLVPGAALVFSWAQEPLVMEEDGATVPGGRVVHRQFWAFLQGSLGISDWLLLDLAVPVALYQSGSRPMAELPEVSALAFGELKLGARAQLGRLGPLDWAAGLDLWLPTGSQEAFASDGSLRLQPKVVAGGAAGQLEYGGTLGVLYRDPSNKVLTETGSAVTFTAAAAWRTGPWRFGPELFGRYQFDGTETSPVEALLGGHWRWGDFDAGLAIGTGLNRAPGAAPLRIVSQLSWRPAPEPKGPSAEELARQEASRREAARREAAEAERLAAERAAAERLAAEQAAAAAAALALATADDDADRIPNPADACPAQPGPASDDAARNGCPARPAQALVVVTRERIEILQAVQFETGKDAIRPESQGLLTEVAQVLADHPELVRVQVEGHTDAQGAAAFNLALSGKRAAAVKRWLVERGGVSADRLTSHGFGSSRPVASNETPEGRALNRRVEFKIVEQR